MQISRPLLTPLFLGRQKCGFASELIKQKSMTLATATPSLQQGNVDLTNIALIIHLVMCKKY